MKSFRFSFLFILLLVSSALYAKPKTESFKVLGNCGMCKNRIENALKIPGVSSAIWNSETKLLTITYETTQVKAKHLHQMVAAVGHDTEKVKSKDKVYSKLPGCCQYDRSGKISKGH